jgi:dihydrofolate reductase
MRSITVTEFLSLDGVIEEPMWTMPYWNDETARFKGEETTPNDCLLLGRVTYEGFAAAWPQRTGDDTGATYFNGTRKYVVSNTLTTADWNNSQIIRGDVVAEITRLKQKDGENLVVHGSGKLVQTLLQHHLVDRIRLLVYPVVLGKGQRLFEDGTTANLKLLETRPLSTGVVGLIYEVVRP